jgi:WW domain
MTSASHWRGHAITKHVDPDTGYFYYRNHTTQETYWDKPAIKFLHTGVEVSLAAAKRPSLDLAVAE